MSAIRPMPIIEFSRASIQKTSEEKGKGQSYIELLEFRAQKLTPTKLYLTLTDLEEIDNLYGRPKTQLRRARLLYDAGAKAEQSKQLNLCKRSEGFGDSIYKFTHHFVIAKVMTKIRKKYGWKCKCEMRRVKWNRRVSYSKWFGWVLGLIKL